MWRTLAVVSTLLVFIAPAHPTTHLVRPDGAGEGATIQEAVDVSGAGDAAVLADADLQEWLRSEVSGGRFPCGSLL